MKKTIGFILILVPFWIFAQKQNQELLAYEDSIQSGFRKLIMAENDSTKTSVNDEIIRLFTQVLRINNSFTYPFDSLSNMGILTSPDKKFRIYNWNLQFNNGEFMYYGFLQLNPKQFKEINIYPLIDNSKNIENPENIITTNENWFGALYYQIIAVKDRKNTYYTLLGWDGNNDFTNKKIIDVLYFTKSNKPKFGKSIFKLATAKKKRIIFEYSYLASMTLKFNEKLNMIVYDHLAPSDPKFEGKYQFYGPDFSYNGLYYKNGKWQEEINIDVRNPKTKVRSKKNISYTF